MANDPGWGNRNNEGPPDLDEVMRQFSRKINALFGKKLLLTVHQMTNRVSPFFLFLA